MAARPSSKGPTALDPATARYMNETLELLVLSNPISPALPPLDLTDWTPAVEDNDISDDLLGLAASDAEGEDEDMEDTQLTALNGTQATKAVAAPAMPEQTPPKVSAPEPPKAKRRPISFAESYSKDKFAALAEQSRVRGKQMKRAGDAKLKVSSDTERHEFDLSILYHSDSILLFIYSFWCEGLMYGRRDENGNLTKPHIKADDWNTLFPLLSMVRSNARSPPYFKLLISFLNLVEALIVQYLQLPVRRGLHATFEKQLLLAKNSDADTPQSTSDDSTSAKTCDTFLNYSSALEKTIKLFASARDIQCLSVIRQDLPDLYDICISTEAARNHVMEPAKPWQFAFGLDTTGGYAAFAHVVSFGRALLEAIAKQRNLDFTPEWDIA